MTVSSTVACRTGSPSRSRGPRLGGAVLPPEIHRVARRELRRVLMEADVGAVGPLHAFLEGVRDPVPPPAAARHGDRRQRSAWRTRATAAARSLLAPALRRCSRRVPAIRIHATSRPRATLRRLLPDLPATPPAPGRRDACIGARLQAVSAAEVARRSHRTFSRSAKERRRRWNGQRIMFWTMDLSAGKYQVAVRAGLPPADFKFS